MVLPTLCDPCGHSSLSQQPTADRTLYSILCRQRPRFEVGTLINAAAVQRAGSELATGMQCAAQRIVAGNQIESRSLAAASGEHPSLLVFDV